MSGMKDFVGHLDNQPILIFGLGKSGLSTAKAFQEAGIEVVVDDDNVKNLDAAKNHRFEILNEADDLSRFAFLVLSPGIPLTHPKPHEIVDRARAADLEIVCDIELFSRVYSDTKTIGITGTNGKSTTASLMHHALIETGHKALLGGNIGTPVFDLNVDENTEWVVLEISSFQIDLCPTFRPNISLILNITPDHIDRHGSMEEYVDVKERLIELGRSAGKQLAVICTDDSYTEKIYERAVDLKLRDVIGVSADNKVPNGVFVKDDTLYDGIDHEDVDEALAVGGMGKIVSLRGVHNQQNTACVYAALKKVGIGADKIWSAIETFPGLKHRQFMVRTINGVGYVNDSKSTNAASAAVALACQDNVYWIVGGRKKKTGLDGLENFFSHIKHAFLIGESSDDFAKWFDKYGMEYTRCISLDNALNDAHIMAQKRRGQPGGAGVVLLSPACASFDQYKSFEHRGDEYTDLVMNLEE